VFNIASKFGLLSENPSVPHVSQAGYGPVNGNHTNSVTFDYLITYESRLISLVIVMAQDLNQQR